ncbi:MAG: glycosidase, partial [Pseudomonadota bacterium]|nr:glycosidase [Pseudomonadota bacterium]
MTQFPPRFVFDQLVLVPDDIDLARSPLAGKLDMETFVLGAFNPGLTRLANGNLLMMVRIAEALREPIGDGHVHVIRWEADGFVIDRWPLELADTADPRKFLMRGGGWKVMALTSLSWLLPVELSPDGTKRVAIHYDKAIAPAGDWQCYGLEDARISRVGDEYLMTTCSVSPERHSTTLYRSCNGLDWT